MSFEGFEAKRGIVERELSRLMAAIFPGRVSRLEYRLRDSGDEQQELVLIHFAGGYTRRVDVTGLDGPQSCRAVLDELCLEVV